MNDVEMADDPQLDDDFIVKDESNLVAYDDDDDEENAQECSALYKGSQDKLFKNMMFEKTKREYRSESMLS